MHSVRLVVISPQLFSSSSALSLVLCQLALLGGAVWCFVINKRVQRGLGSSDMEWCSASRQLVSPNYSPFWLSHLAFRLPLILHELFYKLKLQRVSRPTRTWEHLLFLNLEQKDCLPFQSAHWMKMTTRNMNENWSNSICRNVGWKMLSSDCVR